MRTLLGMLAVLFIITLGVALTGISTRAWTAAQPVDAHCHRVAGTPTTAGRYPVLCDEPDGDTTVEWREAR